MISSKTTPRTAWRPPSAAGARRIRPRNSPSSWRCSRAMENSRLHPHSHAHSVAARDPVCGMTVDLATAKQRAEHGGREYVFCGAGCRAKFVAEPEKYLVPKPPASEEPVKPGTIYTCPMHPDIRKI